MRGSATELHRVTVLVWSRTPHPQPLSPEYRGEGRKARSPFPTICSQTLSQKTRQSPQCVSINGRMWFDTVLTSRDTLPKASYGSPADCSQGRSVSLYRVLLYVSCPHFFAAIACISIGRGTQSATKWWF